METLGDIVESGRLDSQVFLSDCPISGNGSSKYYVVDSVVGNTLHVFPMDYEGSHLLAREKPVGLFYSQHENDIMKKSENLEEIYNSDFGYLAELLKGSNNNSGSRSY